MSTRSSLPQIPLVLGSTSPYRKELLERLGLSFSCKSPLFDEETAKLGSRTPDQLCTYLAEQKATSLASPHVCVIGGDQLLEFRGEVFGKPHLKEKAEEQLFKLQGQTHRLLSAVSIFHPQGRVHFLNVCEMTMRPLSKDKIRDYVAKDKPLDCAGSYKIEKHGVSLFTSIKTEDFTAIQGLPLLRTGQELQNFGYEIPG